MGGRAQVCITPTKSPTHVCTHAHSPILQRPKSPRQIELMYPEQNLSAILFNTATIDKL